MTIKDIANLAGVSTATVSKVINDKAENISGETKSRIHSIIAEHDYVPYQRVVDQVSQRSNLVALMITDANDIFAAELLRGVEDFFFEKEYSVIVCSLDASPQKEQAYIKMLKKQNVHGLIRFPLPNLSEESIQSLEHEDIHSVVLDDTKKTPHALKTFFNNRAGGFLATEHLIQAGHERIGYIFPQTELPYLLDRFAGYQAALEENHIPFDPSLVYNATVKSRKQCGYDGAKYLMSHMVTAIFCCDDHVAVGAYRAIQECGLKIPQDISVMGFDDTIFCEMLEPCLSSIKQSAYDIGKNSAELLYKKLSGIPIDSEQVQIQPQLIARSSVAPPNSTGIHRRNRCVIFGDIRAEVILEVEQGKDVSLRKAHSMCVVAGGTAVEKARQLAEQGTEVFLVGFLGNDAYGQQVYDQLHQSGIKLDGVLFDQQKPTGTAFVVSNTGGNREMVVVDGSNTSLGSYPLESIDWILTSAQVCLYDTSVPAPLLTKLRNVCNENQVTLEAL